MAKMGRPKEENPRVKTIGIRLTNDEYTCIKEYASTHNTTITQTVLKGIRDYISKPAK